MRTRLDTLLNEMVDDRLTRFVWLVFDSEGFKLLGKQWVIGHTESLGTTCRRSSQFEQWRSATSGSGLRRNVELTHGIGQSALRR